MKMTFRIVGHAILMLAMWGGVVLAAPGNSKATTKQGVKRRPQRRVSLPKNRRAGARKNVGAGDTKGINLSRKQPLTAESNQKGPKADLGVRGGMSSKAAKGQSANAPQDEGVKNLGAASTPDPQDVTKKMREFVISDLSDKEADFIKQGLGNMGVLQSQDLEKPWTVVNLTQFLDDLPDLDQRLDFLSFVQMAKTLARQNRDEVAQQKTVEPPILTGLWDQGEMVFQAEPNVPSSALYKAAKSVEAPLKKVWTWDFSSAARLAGLDGSWIKKGWNACAAVAKPVASVAASVLNRLEPVTSLAFAPITWTQFLMSFGGLSFPSFRDFWKPAAYFCRAFLPQMSELKKAPIVPFVGQTVSHLSMINMMYGDAFWDSVSRSLLTFFRLAYRDSRYIINNSAEYVLPSSWASNVREGLRLAWIVPERGLQWMEHKVSMLASVPRLVSLFFSGFYSPFFWIPLIQGGLQGAYSIKQAYERGAFDRLSRGGFKNAWRQWVLAGSHFLNSELRFSGAVRLVASLANLVYPSAGVWVTKAFEMQRFVSLMSGWGDFATYFGGQEYGTEVDVVMNQLKAQMSQSVIGRINNAMSSVWNIPSKILNKMADVAADVTLPLVSQDVQKSVKSLAYSSDEAIWNVDAEDRLQIQGDDLVRSTMDQVRANMAGIQEGYAGEIQKGNAVLSKLQGGDDQWSEGQVIASQGIRQKIERLERELDPKIAHHVAALIRPLGVNTVQGESLRYVLLKLVWQLANATEKASLRIRLHRYVDVQLKRVGDRYRAGELTYAGARDEVGKLMNALQNPEEGAFNILGKSVYSALVRDVLKKDMVWDESACLFSGMKLLQDHWALAQNALPAAGLSATALAEGATSLQNKNPVAELVEQAFVAAQKTDAPLSEAKGILHGIRSLFSGRGSVDVKGSWKDGALRMNASGVTAQKAAQTWVNQVTQALGTAESIYALVKNHQNHLVNRADKIMTRMLGQDPADLGKASAGIVPVNAEGGVGQNTLQDKKTPSSLSVPGKDAEPQAKVSSVRANP